MKISSMQLRKDMLVDRESFPSNDSKIKDVIVADVILPLLSLKPYRSQGEKR
jgi:hypothetical protein